MEEFQISIIGIIIILAFYLPGYFFRKFYFSNFSTKQLGMGDWYDRFFMSIFLGMLIQFLSASILHRNFSLYYDKITVPINRFLEELIKQKIPELDFTNLKTLTLYLIITMCFSCFLGIAIRNVVRFTKLDLYYAPFRFANIWHYYFRGEIVKIKDFQLLNKKNGKWVLTRADILVNTEKDNEKILYNGIISQYDLSTKSDKLERIYLTKAKIYKKSDGFKGFKEIPGDIFIIENSQILNINLSYDILSKAIGKKKKIKEYVIYCTAILILFAPSLVVPYFYFHKVSFLSNVAAMILSMFGLLLFYSGISMIFLNKEKYTEKYKANNKMWVLGVIFLMIFMLLFLIKLLLYPELSLFKF